MINSVFNGNTERHIKSKEFEGNREYNPTIKLRNTEPVPGNLNLGASN